MQHGPTVSIVIPAYNAGDWIDQAIQSVLGQSYDNFEIVVVDDGSTDDTSTVVQQYGDPVRYVWKENGGSASARNRGIAEAQGTYIAFLDADDVWHPAKLARQMDVHEQEASPAWSYTDVELIDTRSGALIHRKSAVREHPEGDVLDQLITGNFIVASTVLVHRRVFDAVGRFDESSLHRISEDWDMWLRIAAQYPVRYIDAPLVQMHQHAERKTEAMNLEHALSSRKAIIEKAMQRNPARLAGRRDHALANLYVNLGRKWMDREERRRARTLFLRALRHAPLRSEAWAYGAASFLPRPVLEGIGQLRGWLRQYRGATPLDPASSSITD